MWYVMIISLLHIVFSSWVEVITSGVRPALMMIRVCSIPGRQRKEQPSGGAGNVPRVGAALPLSKELRKSL